VQLPITIPLRRSPRLLWVLGLAHLAAVGLLWPLVIPVAAKVPLAAAILFSAWRSLGRAFRPAYAALHLGKDGTLEVDGGSGARLAAAVLPQTTVLPGLVVLLLRLGRHTVSLALPRDAMAADDHRRLRLWLRWRAAAR
jgi:toxin CptA